MHRFFIAAESIQGGFIHVSGPDAEHMRVLRIRQNETIIVCDGEGTDFVCTVKSMDSREALLEIEEQGLSTGEPSVSCTIYAAFPKADKAEMIVQKSVELGADAIVFFPTERCVSKPDAGSAIKKCERWQKISEEAAKQSGRGKIPKVRICDTFDAAIKEASAAELPMFLYENESNKSIKEPLADNSEKVSIISIMSGSEGGFEALEAEKAKASGMICVSMGKRILRCETAPLAALSAVMLSTDNF